MKRFLSFFAYLSIAAISVSIASGSSANCSWVAPTVYTDGSAIGATDIDHYTLSWAPATGQTGPTGSVNVPASTLKTLVNVPCGTVSFTVSVTTGASAKYPNATSAPSGLVPYATGITCTPNPPSGLAVQ